MDNMMNQELDVTEDKPNVTTWPFSRTDSRGRLGRVKENNNV
jgi:hypothetical protein